MNPGSKSVYTMVLLFLGAVLYVGCASGPMKRSERVTSSLQSVESQVLSTISQINATNASLENLMSPEQSDTQKAYGDFSKEAGRMENSGNDLLDALENMTARRGEYLAEWGKEGASYTNPRIRELSEQRRVELNNTFNRISGANVGVRGALETYMRDITEIRSYLANDLTAQGINNMRPVAQSAYRDGENVKGSLEPVLASISRARAVMAPVE